MSSYHQKGYERCLDLANATNNLNQAIAANDRGAAQQAMGRFDREMPNGWHGLSRSHHELAQDCHDAYNQARNAAKDKFGI